MLLLEEFNIASTATKLRAFLAFKHFVLDHKTNLALEKLRKGFKQVILVKIVDGEF